MSSITLYSTVLCPFAHRVRLVLAEKSLPAEIVEIDLNNKPADFLDISPEGKVPVLQHGGHRVWESAIINEYLEEAFPDSALLPREPMQRTAARLWIHFADTRLYAATGRLLHSDDPQVHAAAIAQVQEALRCIENQALARHADAGPYWLGAEYSLADLTFYPWFEQLSALERFRAFRMPAGLARLDRWRETVAGRVAVRSIAQPSEFYIERYAVHFGDGV